MSNTLRLSCQGSSDKETEQKVSLINNAAGYTVELSTGLRNISQWARKFLWEKSASIYVAATQTKNTSQLKKNQYTALAPYYRRSWGIFEGGQQFLSAKTQFCSTKK